MPGHDLLAPLTEAPERSALVFDVDGTLSPIAPSPELAAGFRKVGEQLTQDWLKKAGADGQAVVDAYKKAAM